MTGKPVWSKNTPAALADEWQRLMHAAHEPGIRGADSGALIEHADAVLDRPADTPTNTEACRAAEILFRHLFRATSDGNASAATLVASNELEEEVLAAWQRRVERAERLVADQIALVEKLNSHGLTTTAIIARQLLDTFGATRDLSRRCLNNMQVLRAARTERLAGVETNKSSKERWRWYLGSSPARRAA